MRATAAIIGVALASSWTTGAGFGYEYSAKPSTGLDRFQYSQVRMGVSVVMTLYAPSQEVAERAANAAYARFEELEQIMSDYRRDSELSHLIAKSGEGPQKVSPDMMRVLTRSQEVAALSNGEFDITAGPLIKLWRETRKTGTLPYHSQVVEAKKLVGWKNLVLDPRNGTANLKVKGVTIDLGGIAKGYACDAAIETLRKNGVDQALVEAGGDIAASHAPPDKKGWTIEVRGWDTPVMLADGAISTSGDTEQFVDIGGRRFSHIVDPRTGYGLTTRVQVTIQAKEGFVTDPLATALSILSKDKWQPLLTRYHAKATLVRDAS